MKVKEICHSITDGSHNPPQGVEVSKYLMLSSKNVFDDEITVEDPRFLTEEDFQQEDKRTQIVPGDVLLTIVGTVGRVAVVTNDMPRFTLQRSVAVLHPHREICLSRYLMYALRSRRALIEKTARGVAQKGIYLGEVGDIDLFIPILEQQESIVGILDKIVCLIQARMRQLDALDTLIKARFVEMFGDPVNNDRNWPTLSLEESCDGIGDGLHGTPEYDEHGEYPFINGNNLIDGRIVVTPATKMVNEQTFIKNKSQLGNNAVLISINGTLGKMAFYHGESIMLGKSACYCNLKPTINREFVYQLMRTEAFAGYLDDNSTKSTIKNVGLKAMRSFRLIQPPKDAINSFVAFSRQVDKSKAVVQKALERAQLLFDSLMQKYFNIGESI